MGLKEKAKALNGGKGIPFMEGREKGEIDTILNSTIEVIDYGFIKGDEGEYIVFGIRGNNEEFFFGNPIMTEAFKEFTPEEKAEIELEGIPVRLTKQKNKKGNRTYMAVEFYPE